MPQSITHVMRRFTERHTCGATSTSELISRVYGFAIRPIFFQLLKELPPPVVESLKQLADCSKGHPEDIEVFIFRDWFAKYDGIDPVIARRNVLTIKYWSFLKLREHFYPGTSPPVFEPVRKIGTVNKSLERHGSIILLGEISSGRGRIDWDLGWPHPIHLARPGGGTMTVTINHWEWLVSYRSSMPSGIYDPEFFLEHLTPDYNSFHYPVFSKNLESPADAPPGTEVYVDRTAAVEIMPIEEIDRIVLGDYVD